MKNNKEKSGMSPHSKAHGAEYDIQKLRVILRPLQDAIFSGANDKKPLRQIYRDLKDWTTAAESSIPANEVCGVPGEKESQGNLLAMVHKVIAVISFVLESKGRHPAQLKENLVKFVTSLVELVQPYPPKKRIRTLDEQAQANGRQMIRELKIKAKITQTELALMLNVRVNTISRWMAERNAISMGNLREIRRIYDQRIRTGDSFTSDKELKMRFLRLLKEDPSFAEQVYQELKINGESHTGPI